MIIMTRVSYRTLKKYIISNNEFLSWNSFVQLLIYQLTPLLFFIEKHNYTIWFSITTACYIQETDKHL